MAERAQNLQDTFLNHVRKAKVPVTIFLINGVKLQGVVTWFDNFCVLLRRDGRWYLGIGSDHTDPETARRHGVTVAEVTGSNVVSVARRQR